MKRTKFAVDTKADGSTVTQQALPAIEQQYKTGKMTPLLEGARQ